MLCMVLTDDLMFSQLIANALPEDCQIRPASNQSAAENSLDADVNSMVVDLSLGIDVQRLAETAAGLGIRLIGVASHVHVNKIKAARAAGFHEVLTRSQVADCLRLVLNGSENGR